MSMTEAARLRQQERRAERRANPRPGDEEAKKARNQRRWHEVRKHDKEYRTHRVNGTRERRWRLFGGSQELFNQLWEDQQGLCGICSKELSPPIAHGDKPRVRKAEAQFDHCHDNLRPRGLLCIPCNTKLGWYESHRAIIEEYLCPYS